MELDNTPTDLEQVIEDSVNDSVAEVEPTPEVETPTEPVVEETPEDVQVVTPGANTEEPAEGDDFAKKFGLAASSITGRENRIPYSRVKKIVTKAEKDVETRVRKELEGTLNPRITEFETKVKDYEGRLERVAQFENILENDPKTFLQMLSKVPVYKEFFDFVSQAASTAQGQEPQKPADTTAGMPEPDQTLSDGSKVYSMDGLKALMKWQADQVEQRTIQQVQQRYAPIEQAWQTQEQLAKMAPVVDKQITEARTWDRFAELEPKVVEILKADKQISLEKAYLKAYQDNVVPKMQLDRNAMRTEILAELKKKPVSSSMPVGGGTTPVSKTQPSGPMTMEDIIAKSLEDAGLKS